MNRCGLAVLLVLAVPALGQPAVLDPAIDTLTGILNEPPAGDCPPGKMSLLGVEYETHGGVTGWARLRADHPARTKAHQAATEAGVRGSEASRLQREVVSIERDLLDLDDEVRGVQAVIKEREERMAEVERDLSDVAGIRAGLVKGGASAEDLDQLVASYQADRRREIEDIGKVIEEKRAKLRVLEGKVGTLAGDLETKRQPLAAAQQAAAEAAAVREGLFKAADAIGNACP